MTPHTQSTGELERLVKTISGDDNAKFHPKGYVNKLEALIRTEVDRAVKAERLKGAPLSSRGKLDRIIALAEKEGYEKCLKDQERLQSLVQDNKP